VEQGRFVQSPYLVGWDGSWNIADSKTRSKDTKEKSVEKAHLKRLQKDIVLLQKRLYAEQTQSLLIVFQAMDAAGKDGTISAVFSRINPQGCRVDSFKRPTSVERGHDYLWRIHQKTPHKGMIQIFNRSHYEEVLITSIFPDILKGQKLPSRSLEEEFFNRYKQIRQFESLLTETGTRVVKFWLNISKSEQKNRLLRRTEDDTRYWKHESADLQMRERWDDFMLAYQDALVKTSRPNAPWYAIPADDKPYMRRCVADIIHRTLLDMNPQYPRVSTEERAQIEKDRQTLLSETQN
jgi:PPK2 family polyphosphate:nucleotide phosphotransferase